jgi:hypothetical protein
MKNELGTAAEFANKSSDRISHRSGKGMRLRNGIGFLLSAAILAAPGTMQEAVGMVADLTEGANGVIASLVTR